MERENTSMSASTCAIECRARAYARALQSLSGNVPERVGETRKDADERETPIASESACMRASLSASAIALAIECRACA